MLIYAFSRSSYKKTVTRLGDFTRYPITVAVCGGNCDFLLMILDIWQDTVIYEDRTLPIGTLACDALNVSADTLA